MSYQSFSFIIFVAVVLLAYYAARKHQKIVLVMANLAFYIFAGVQYLPFILVTMVATFLTGRKIGRIYADTDLRLATAADAAHKKQLRAEAKTGAKRALALGMGITIALLAVCKYTGFVVENLNALLSALKVPQIPLFRMILPLGISFYSFMALSYVLDIYWKRYKAEEDFLMYAAYLAYFPHVVQGPIDRFNEFRAQLNEPIHFDDQKVAFGAQLMLWGFFKKLVVADRLGLFVDSVFTGWQEFKGFVLIMAVIAYSIQIYADFSGCIDIVTGVSEMFGIHLRKNFNHPYFSRSMGEFWRRWHISLQEWFKDYIYFPVSASGLIRKAKKHFKERDQKRASELFTACFPIFVVWMITGIWHGADWKFVVWGMFHAMLLIGSRVLEPVFEGANRKLKINSDCFAWRVWQMLRTFFLCCVGRIFFRAESVGVAFAMIPKMLNPCITIRELMRPAISYGITIPDICVAIVAILILLVMDIIQEKIRIREALSRKHIVLRWVLIYGCLFAVLFFGIYGPGYGSGGFIYEQF